MYNKLDAMQTLANAWLSASDQAATDLLAEKFHEVRRSLQSLYDAARFSDEFFLNPDEAIVWEGGPGMDTWGSPGETWDEFTGEEGLNGPQPRYL